MGRYTESLLKSLNINLCDLGFTRPAERGIELLATGLLIRDLICSRDTNGLPIVKRVVDLTSGCGMNGAFVRQIGFGGPIIFGDPNGLISIMQLGLLNAPEQLEQTVGKLLDEILAICHRHDLNVDPKTFTFCSPTPAQHVVDQQKVQRDKSSSDIQKLLQAPLELCIDPLDGSLRPDAAQASPGLSSIGPMQYAACIWILTEHGSGAKAPVLSEEGQMIPNMRLHRKVTHRSLSDVRCVLSSEVHLQAVPNKFQNWRELLSSTTRSESNPTPLANTVSFKTPDQLLTEAMEGDLFLLNISRVGGLTFLNNSNASIAKASEKGARILVFFEDEISAIQNECMGLRISSDESAARLRNRIKSPSIGMNFDRMPSFSIRPTPSRP